MALYDAPPHSVTIYGPPTAVRDGGGGTTITHGTTRQANVPCSINTTGASSRGVFDQDGMTVTHTIAILTSVLSSAVARGDKAVTDDTSETYHIVGIQKGRAYGSIPGFTYLQCQQQL